MSPILTHFRSLQAVQGVAATISRGNAECPATVVLGRTDSAAVSSRESIAAADRQDVLIAVADYKPAGTVTEPENNDRCQYTNEVTGEVITLEVMPLNEGEKPFIRWAGGAVYRVHFKVIDRSQA